MGRAPTGSFNIKNFPEQPAVIEEQRRGVWGKIFAHQAEVQGERAAELAVLTLSTVSLCGRASNRERLLPILNGPKNSQRTFRR